MEQTKPRVYHSALRNQRKQAILDFMAAFHQENAYWPSLKEIAESVTGKSEDSGNVSVWVNQLIREGFLARKGNRALVLVNPQRKRYEETEN